MKKPNFKELQELVFLAAKTCIEEFAASEDNKNVYALVFDLNEDYGDVLISINTEEALQKTINAKYSHYTTDQVSGLNGLKYSPGDFSFFDIGKFPKEFDSWSSSYNSYLENLKSDRAYLNNTEKFSDVIVTVINSLNSEIAQLDKTEEFIAFHCFHDIDEETSIRLILKTVSQSRFDQVFPEYKEYEAFINNIDSLNESERLKIWFDMLIAYCNYESSRYSNQFFRRHCYLDIEPEIVKLGNTAIEPILTTLDSLIYIPEFNEKDTKEWEDTGAFSRRANVVHLLLDVIASIGYSSKKVEEKLLHYIVQLQAQAEANDGTIGLNLCLTARCLHFLNNTFPMDEMCPSTNRLLNFNQYINKR